MSQLTYFILTRNIFDSAIWRDDPHILKLFIYLVGNARHSKTPKKYPNVIIKRGELVTSLNDVSENNEYLLNGVIKKWSRAKVSRMLNKLVEQRYIILKSDTYGTHINICNYDTYQDPNTYKSDSGETVVKQLCNNCETTVSINNNVNNENNVNKEKGFVEFWNQFHTITKKPKTDRESTLKYWKKLSIEEKRIAYKNIPLFFNSLKDKDYCKKARTYLSDKNFNDEFNQDTQEVNGHINLDYYKRNIEKYQIVGNLKKVEEMKIECENKLGIKL